MDLHGGASLISETPSLSPPRQHRGRGTGGPPSTPPDARRAGRPGETSGHAFGDQRTDLHDYEGIKPPARTRSQAERRACLRGAVEKDSLDQREGRGGQDHLLREPGRGAGPWGGTGPSW